MRSPGFAATNQSCKRCSKLYLHYFIEYSWDSTDTVKSSFEGLLHIYTLLLKANANNIIANNNETKTFFWEGSVLTETLKRFIVGIKVIVNGSEFSSDVKYLILIKEGYQPA